MDTSSQLDDLSADELLNVLLSQTLEVENRLKEKSKLHAELNEAISSTKRETENVLSSRNKLAKQINELVCGI